MSFSVVRLDFGQSINRTKRSTKYQYGYTECYQPFLIITTIRLSLISPYNILRLMCCPDLCHNILPMTNFLKMKELAFIRTRQRVNQSIRILMHKFQELFIVAAIECYKCRDSLLCLSTDDIFFYLACYSFVLVCSFLFCLLEFLFCCLSLLIGCTEMWLVYSFLDPFNILFPIILILFVQLIQRLFIEIFIIQIERTCSVDLSYRNRGFRLVKKYLSQISLVLKELCFELLLGHIGGEVFYQDGDIWRG